ncbi:MAG: GTP 3',8-cyclase MoaA [Acidobacteriia bacterium]|nr:GTP 3',8-cyclase MoaA [Terriglobia bacterium]
MALIDTQGRRINYLRLSVTDRCNLRCRYCMPAEGIRKLNHSEILSFEDLYRLACIAVGLGLDKIRVTGGEPLVRKGVVGFLQRLATIPGLSELVLSTNGMLLRDMAKDLRRAGVQRLNISLDSLRPEVFAEITRGGHLQQVLDGLAASEEAGFPPAKINVVVMRGVNDDEVLDFAALTLRTAYTVRFIEYMPTMMDPDWRSIWVPAHEVLERIQQRYMLRSIEVADRAGPARSFRIAGAPGTLGIISPISHCFCDRCNRIRITATGMAKGCLFAADAVDLKPCLRAGDDVVRETLRRIVTSKPARHGLFAPQPQNEPFSMAQIGG